jgi:hypothetical protein
VKSAIELNVVERRRAARGGDRRQIDGRDENESSRHSSRIERANQLAPLNFSNKFFQASAQGLGVERQGLLSWPIL